MLYATGGAAYRPGRAEHERAGSQERARLSEAAPPLAARAGPLPERSASSEGEGHCLSSESLHLPLLSSKQIKAYELTRLPAHSPNRTKISTRKEWGAVVVRAVSLGLL